MSYRCSRAMIVTKTNLVLPRQLPVALMTKCESRWMQLAVYYLGSDGECRLSKKKLEIFGMWRLHNIFFSKICIDPLVTDFIQSNKQFIIRKASPRGVRFQPIRALQTNADFNFDHHQKSKEKIHKQRRPTMELQEIIGILQGFSHVRRNSACWTQFRYFWGCGVASYLWFLVLG